MSLGHFYKFNFRRDTALLIKNFSLHINCMRRHNFLLAPCLALEFEFIEAPFNKR